MTAARDTNLRAAGANSLDDLLRDYRYVRLGDLASLAFCNNWPRTEEYGYVMVLEGTSLVVTPDPLNGRTIEIDIEAQEIADQTFASAADARRVIAGARSVTLQGRISGLCG